MANEFNTNKNKLLRAVFEFEGGYKVTYRKIARPEDGRKGRTFYEAAATLHGRGQLFTVCHYPNKTNAIILIASTNFEKSVK